MAARPFAAFDIDGTLIRWQLFHAIGDALAKDGLIDPEDFLKVKEARLNWKRRTDEQSFSNYEKVMVTLFEKTLKGLEVDAYIKSAEAVFEEYKEQVYTYTRDLIEQLKQRGYILFAVSGSPDIIVEKMAQFYGFDDFAASVYPARGGRFTGQIELSVFKKIEMLKSLVAKHRADLSGSLAVGDTELDIPMLSFVESPIAFNPTKELFGYAASHNWTVVLERKNMVYHLEPSGSGQYQLKT